MLTHYLGVEEVEGYSRDFIKRLRVLGIPTRWFALGESGLKMAARLYRHLEPQEISQVEIGEVRFDRKTSEITFINSIDDIQFDDSRVLVIDSAVHSGTSMLKLIQTLNQKGAKNIHSYTLVLKRGTKIIPTFFGLVIGDKDRVYFDLNVLPNNRHHNTPYNGILRPIASTDVKLKIPPVLKPLDKVTTGDLYYDHMALQMDVYVYEYDNEVAGYVSYRRIENALFIDSVATATKYKGKKIAATLLRWAETWARSRKCDTVALWAYEDIVPMYAGMEFEPISGQLEDLGSEKYQKMAKKILYNVRPSEE